MNETQATELLQYTLIAGARTYRKADIDRAWANNAYNIFGVRAPGTEP